jgi:hypothetical protein
VADEEWRRTINARLDRMERRVNDDLVYDGSDEREHAHFP